MANETNTVKKETGSNLTPIIIIGGIFLATIFGIYMIMNSGDNPEDTAKKDGTTTNTSGKSSSEFGTKIPNYSNASPGASPAHFKGSDSAPVMIEEFADFRCPACRVYHSVMNEVISKYGSRVKVIYRQYPIQPKAYDAAVASEAAGLQGKFWQMQNIIFNNQSNWANAPNHKVLFADYAKTIGLDVERYSNDILGLQTKSRVDADMKRGKDLNVRSTPTVIMNGKMMDYSKVSSLAGISKAIDAEIARVQPKDDSQTKSGDESSDKKEADKDESSDKKAEDSGEDKVEEKSDK